MHCKVCSAPIPALDSAGQYRCSYCDTLAQVDEQFVDRIVLTANDSPRSCPVCQLLLRHGSIERVAIEACGNCYGFLMAHDGFGHVVAQRRKDYQGADVTPGLLDQEKLKRRLPCPACHGAMEAHAYCGPGNTVLTTCGSCHLIWLDAGDLTRIEQAPGRRQPVESAPRTSPRPLSLAAQVEAEYGRDDDSSNQGPWTLLTTLLGIFR